MKSVGICAILQASIQEVAATTAAPTPAPTGAPNSVWAYGKCNADSECVTGSLCQGDQWWKGCIPIDALQQANNCTFYHTCTPGDHTTCCQTQQHNRYCWSSGYCHDTQETNGPTPTAAPGSLWAYEKCTDQAECLQGTVCQGDQWWKGCIPTAAAELAASCTFYNACDNTITCCQTTDPTIHPRYCWSSGYCHDTPEPPSATIGPLSVKENGYCTDTSQCEAVPGPGSLVCTGNICTPNGCAGRGHACGGGVACCSTATEPLTCNAQDWCEAGR